MSLFAKLGLVVGGAALIAIAQTATLPLLKSQPVWSAMGLVGTALAFIGGLFVAVTDQNSTRELVLAQRAIQSAQEVQYENEDIVLYLEEIERATQLYGAIRNMRSALEKLFLTGSPTIREVATQLLSIADRELKVALDFQISGHWTLGVYQVESDANSAQSLVCVAQTRSEKCELADARKWPEGRGAGWLALSNERDVIIPDLKSEAMGSMFEGVITKEDILKYRSIVAVPIRIASTNEKWGVVIATSNEENHFSLDPRPGVAPAEGARALAGMLALALAAQHLGGVPTQASPQL